MGVVITRTGMMRLIGWGHDTDKYTQTLVIKMLYEIVIYRIESSWIKRHRKHMDTQKKSHANQNENVIVK